MPSSPARDRPIPALKLCQSLLKPIITCCHVSSVAVFGSLADDSADIHSDVDLMVAVDHASAAWEVAKIITSTHPLLFYRMFSSASQPAGRYWFVDQSPMTRLDISFHSSQNLENICQTQTYMGHHVNCRMLYQRESAGPASLQQAGDNPLPLDITELETQLGLWIYRMNRAIGCAIRKTPYQHKLEDCIGSLRLAMVSCQHITLAGGDGVELASRQIKYAAQLGLLHAADS